MSQAISGGWRAYSSPLSEGRTNSPRVHISQATVSMRVSSTGQIDRANNDAMNSRSHRPVQAAAALMLTHHTDGLRTRNGTAAAGDLTSPISISSTMNCSSAA